MSGPLVTLSVTGARQTETCSAWFQPAFHVSVGACVSRGDYCQCSPASSCRRWMLSWMAIRWRSCFPRTARGELFKTRGGLTINAAYGFAPPC